MACSTNTFLLILTVFISLNHDFAGTLELPEATNGRIETKPGKRCLLYHWDVTNLYHPCTRPDFNFTLSVRLFKGSGASETEKKHEFSSKQRPVNISLQSFSQCLFDSGGNVSCCQDIGSSAQNITSAHEVSFSDYEKITFAVTLCAGGFSPGPVKKLLPWRDPCFTYKPCQQREFAVCHPSVDDYDCSCQYRWTGKNCTVLIKKTDLTYNARKCLNTSSQLDVQHLYGKNVEECKSVCLGSKCKSFEFKRTPSSLHGNCTLHNSNILQHDLVACDADLFQLKSFLSSSSTNSTDRTPGLKPDPGLSTVVIAILGIIGVIVLTFIITVLVIRPFQSAATPTRSHSNLGALPHGTRPGGDQEMTPLAPDKAT